MGKLTISMVIFHSFLLVYKKVIDIDPSPMFHVWHVETSRPHISRLHSTQSFDSSSPRRRCSRQSPVALSKSGSMSTSDAGACVEPSRGSDLFDLSVQCLNGEGCMLKLNGSCTGWEVYRMVSKQLPQKKGAQLTLHHLDSSLILHKELQAQGIMGKAATLSCTYVPTDLYAAWCTVQSLPVSQKELALQGVTQIAGATTTKYLHHLPESLEHLTFGNEFNQSLEGVTLPSSLQTLTFGSDFDQSLEHVTLPSSLQTLTFGSDFDRSLKHVTLPSSLQTLTFGSDFDQSLEHVTLPSSLQTLTFGHWFNQSLEGVTLPSNLQTLTFGESFNQSLEHVTLPSSLQTLTFGERFTQSLERVTLPSSLQTLTFGHDFNQSLEHLTLPSNLQTLKFGYRFNQSLERVTLPSCLQTFTFGECFNQSLERATLPSNLQTLTYGYRFNQSLEGVTPAKQSSDLDIWRVL